jgi:5-methylcytosine-specific restriction endonuclease McrA
MALFACSAPGCGIPSPNRRCPRHTKPRNAPRSPNRDRTLQARMRRAVLQRDGWRCMDCGSTHDLRCCHITPLSQGGSYAPENGITRCGPCDRRTDPYAR